MGIVCVRQLRAGMSGFGCVVGIGKVPMAC
jgi:hypothetical protein